MAKKEFYEWLDRNSKDKLNKNVLESFGDVLEDKITYISYVDEYLYNMEDQDYEVKLIKKLVKGERIILVIDRDIDMYISSYTYHLKKSSYELKIIEISGNYGKKFALVVPLIREHLADGYRHGFDDFEVGNLEYWTESELKAGGHFPQ